MENKFLILAITRPDFFTEEPGMINRLFHENEIDYLHIRKPQAKIEEIENLLSKIKPEYYHRIKIHDGFELARKFALGGLHLNSRNPIPIEGVNAKSISIHDFNEIDKTEGCDYFFISPVFDSISKKGYKAAFDPEELSKKIKGKNAIALGGVTPEKFEFLKSLGFKGAALLSHFFPED